MLLCGVCDEGFRQSRGRRDDVEEMAEIDEVWMAAVADKMEEREELASGDGDGVRGTGRCVTVSFVWR